jgi:hypothetical protein
VALKVGRCAITAKACCHLARKLGRQVVGSAHPQTSRRAIGAEIVNQPLGIANMIRVHVRDQHACQGFVGQGALPQGVPCAFDRLVGDPGVNQCPAGVVSLCVVERPEIDVIKRKRQGHPNPMHTGPQSHQLTGCRLGLAPWVAHSRLRSS